MGDGMSDDSSICNTPKCGNVTQGSYSHCWRCRDNERIREEARVARATAAARSVTSQVIQNAVNGLEGGGPVSNVAKKDQAKKPQASVMLVFPGPDGRRYRIVSLVGEPHPTRPSLQYVLDEEREDTVGAKFWHATTSWTPSSDVKLTDILMSAIRYLMNPHALMANDAEIDGRVDDAATIMAQCNFSGCRLHADHLQDHKDAAGSTIMCPRGCGQPAGHAGEWCFEGRTTR
jgi:hypothetical protein